MKNTRTWLRTTDPFQNQTKKEPEFVWVLFFTPIRLGSFFYSQQPLFPTRLYAAFGLLNDRLSVRRNKRHLRPYSHFTLFRARPHSFYLSYAVLRFLPLRYTTIAAKRAIPCAITPQTLAPYATAPRVIIQRKRRRKTLYIVFLSCFGCFLLFLLIFAHI